MRFRALNHRTEETDRLADERQTEVVFGVAGDGRVSMKGLLMLGEMGTQVPFETIRVMEKYTDRKEAIASSARQRYKRKM